MLVKALLYYCMLLLLGGFTLKSDPDSPNLSKFPVLRYKDIASYVYKFYLQQLVRISYIEPSKSSSCNTTLHTQLEGSVSLFTLKCACSCSCSSYSLMHSYLYYTAISCICSYRQWCIYQAGYIQLLLYNYVSPYACRPV